MHWAEDKGNTAETKMVEEPRALGGLRLCAATLPCPGEKVNFYSKMALHVWTAVTLQLIS